MTAAKKETIPVSVEEVVSILADADHILPWSSIAARIHGIPRREVTMPMVRGVRDVCRKIEAAAAHVNSEPLRTMRRVA